VERLNAFRPRVLMGYTSVLEALAGEERAQRLRLRATGCLEQVTNISEPLPAGSRETIEQAFGVPLTDHYAMAECTALTSGCPFHAGSHLNVDLAYLEVVDDRYRPVADGEPGARILVTNLYNRVQPFIRYEVADVVTMSPSPCPCGSSLPLIQSVSGRTKERFWLLIHGEYRELPCYVFLAAMHHCLEIADHEVVQTGFNHFVVRVAPLPGRTVAPRRVAQLVQQSVDAEGLAGLLDFKVEVVPKLKADPVSGKRQRVRNQIGPPPGRMAKPADALQRV
jgi:phenylacetate-CoA ligase